MNITLKHCFCCSNETNNWIYFGTNFIKLKKLEQKIGKNKKISLDDKINNIGDKQKENFIDWIEDQRNYFKDSTEWLMNNLASKDNRSSKIFLNICQLISINKYLKDYEDKNNEKITIISENYHLIQFLKDNLNKKHNVRSPIGLLLFVFFEKGFFFVKGLFNYIKIIIFFLENYLFAKLSKTKSSVAPSGEIFLFHDLTKSTDFDNSVTQGQIYGGFSHWLSSRKKKIVTLPWFYKDLNNKRKLYKNLRQRDSFIPEDWLNIYDYCNSLVVSFKSAFSINEKIEYPELNISTIIQAEKILNLSNKSAIYLRYIPALKKWGKNLTSFTCFDNYQNQLFDQPIRIFAKSLNIKTKSIGFYPTLHSKRFLAYHSVTDEWNSKSKPDIIACSNNFSKNVLNSQGIPEKRIKVISDLQRENFQNHSFEKKFNKNLLLVLSLFPETNSEMLTKISNINDYLVNDLGLKITVRPHPYHKKKDVLKDLNWNKLPIGWVWSENNFVSELTNSYCIVTMFSSSAIDAILSNNILVVLKSELNIGENFLDTLEEQFPVLKTTSEKELRNKIAEIFKSNIDFYKNEFTKIKNKISLNINKDNYNELLN